MPRFLLSTTRALALLVFATATAAHAQRPASADLAGYDSSRLGGLRYRLIGPARGGRVTAVTGVAQQPHTFYFGSTGGGVWKTVDAGITWRSTGDQAFASASIGALDVADSDPNVVYAGTGSEAIRSNVSIGRGIYKSVDAGRSWRFSGLRDAGQIGALVVHPANPDVVYAAVVGNPFATSQTRGVYRTRNGGSTWERVLFLSDSTGAVDIELKPGSPDVIYASMWHGARRPWTIISGGAEDGIYRSTDGGDHWTRLTGGLPTGTFGKSDLAVSAAAPNRVYALVEAKPGSGLYRSDDSGDSWTLVNTTPGLITRPFYYDNVDADPSNADVVYAGAENFYKSTDGGRTFRTMRTPHGDNHDLWINPRNSQVMIQSNDGGANVSLDGGVTWSTQQNQPTAEIYGVAVDDQYPYRVYGAQQDQGSTLIVPSLPVGALALDEPIQSWRQGPGCETGPVAPNRTNPDTVYAGCKGQFSRMSLRSGQEQQRWIGAQSLYGNANRDLRYRFQRVSPLEVSPHEPHTVYFGSQYVHRSRDEGLTWETISPDLTANDPRYRATISGAPVTIDVTGEEMYATLYAIRESPVKAGVIWAGANDGPVSVTQDGGRSWKTVTPPGLPSGGRVQNIEPSPHRAGAAYVAVLRYLLGDFHPYLYKTEDYGATWALLTSGTNGIPADAPTRVVREDPDRAGLLYAGTEFGMYISFDDGAHWHPFQRNLPITPVTDIRVHRKDLVLATQGRAFWILDDLTPLHELRDGIIAERAHLFAPREAIRYRYRAGFGGDESDRAPGDDAPQYPPAGAMIDYWLSDAGGPVTLEVLDATGNVVRSFASAGRGGEPRSASGLAPSRSMGASMPADAPAGPVLPARAGLNRLVWDMTYPGPATGRGRGAIGPLAAPGRYVVRLTASGSTSSQPLVLHADPRVLRDGVTQGDMEEQLAFSLQVRDLVSQSIQLGTRLRALRSQASPASDPTLAEIEAEYFTPAVRYSRPGLDTHITYLYGMSLGADQSVSRDARERYAELKARLEALSARVARM